MNVKSCAPFSEKEPTNPSSTEQTYTPVRHILVTHAEGGLRLDRFVRTHVPGLPISFIQRLLRTGQIRVNGGRVRGGQRLVVGDTVRMPPVRLNAPKKEKTAPDRLVHAVKDRILWRDEHLLFLNKPEGLSAHGGSGNTWGAVDAVRRMTQEQKDPTAPAQPSPVEERPELCHRLDKGTSGCLLFALTTEALRTMATAFREGTVDKHYLALVRGHPQSEKGIITLPLTKGMVRSGERMVVSSEEGAPARTRYRIMARFANASLVHVTPETGRTHQIRVHFQALGHPLAGDGKYGDHAFNERMKKIGLNRLFLHAHTLAFSHPITHNPLTVRAPLDAALMQVLHAQDPDQHWTDTLNMIP